VRVRIFLFANDFLPSFFGLFICGSRSQSFFFDLELLREGFVIGIQPILGPPRTFDLKWADIEEMRLVEAPRGGDILAFRQSHGAAVRAGLIQPTTREDAAKVLVRREIALPLRLVSVGIDDAVARFHASADGAGAKLVAQSSFNVVVFVRKVWSVTWP